MSIPITCDKCGHTTIHRASTVYRNDVVSCQNPQGCNNYIDVTKYVRVKCPECDADNPYEVTICQSCKAPLGRKFDEGKTEWTLFPFEAAECIVKVMMFGAKKYARNNWQHVKPPIRYIDAAYRHLNAWVAGEKNDKETKFSHLWHAGCCILFAIWLELKGKLTNEGLQE